MKFKYFVVAFIAPMLLVSCGNIESNLNSSNRDLSYADKLTYAIDFDLNGGTSPSYKGPQTVESFTRDIFFFDCVKEGINFRGWEYNGTKVFDENGNQLANPTMAPKMIFTAIYANTAKMSISTNLAGAGTITGEGEYAYNTTVDLSARPNPGYRFVGWYYDGNLLSITEDYKCMMWDRDVDIEARFELKAFALDIKANNPIYGLVALKSDINFEYGDSHTEDIDYTTEVTVAAYSKTNVRFLGWYDDNNGLVSTNTVYKFIMPSRDYSLEAKWNHFTVSYNLNGGTQNPFNPTSYTIDDEPFVLCDPKRAGYAFLGWKLNGAFVTSIDPQWIDDVTLDAVWEETENGKKLGVIPTIDETNKTVSYGLYPQTHVDDSVTISALDALTSAKNNGWYLYDGEYYAKKTAFPYDSSCVFDDGTKIVSDTTYWFKCEPIKWNILESANGTYSLVSSMLLDAHRYNEYWSGTKNGVYANNYEKSEIREWLNGTFYDTAFGLDDSLIQETVVDNSASTTNSSTNDYASDDTADKVYLLSYQDYMNTNHFADDVSRYCKVTDWAKANGASYSVSASYKNNGYYWIRSPYSRYSYDAWYVSSGGSLSYYGVHFSDRCVRPSIQLKIS